MYAIVEIAGFQYKVEKDQQLFVNRLEGKEGSKVDFSDVLLIDNNGKVNVGTPVIGGAQVNAKIIEHLKGDKVIVFKKKRRKGYKVRNGHRQYLTKISIESILETGGKAVKKEEAKKEVKATAEVKKATTTSTPSAPKKEVKSASKVTDLTGVGPKLAGLFAEKGFADLKSFSTAKADQLQSILEEAGGKSKTLKAEDLIKQAKTLL